MRESEGAGETYISSNPTAAPRFFIFAFFRRLDDISTALNQSFPGAVMSQPGVAGAPLRTRCGSRSPRAPRLSGSRAGAAAGGPGRGRKGRGRGRSGGSRRSRPSLTAKQKPAVCPRTHARPPVRGQGPAAGPDAGDSPFGPQREFPGHSPPGRLRPYGRPEPRARPAGPEGAPCPRRLSPSRPGLRPALPDANFSVGPAPTSQSRTRPRSCAGPGIAGSTHRGPAAPGGRKRRPVGPCSPAGSPGP